MRRVFWKLGVRSRYRRVFWKLALRRIGLTQIGRTPAAASSADRPSA